MAYVEPYGSKKPPVSIHPLFPAVVALWFAALFGLGSLVLPNILIERAIVMTGIDALVPAAAPPLGVTARIMVSSAMGLIGAVLGFWITRKVARAQSAGRPARTGRRPPQSDYFQEPRARRPISARDELGSTRLETPPAPDPGMGARRRALAMQEDDRPSTFLQAAPLPGAQHDYAPAPLGREPEPLDLARFEAPPQPQAQPETYGNQVAALRNTVPSGQDRPETIAPAPDFVQPPPPDFAQPQFAQPAHHFTPPAPSPVAQAAHDLSRQVETPPQQFAPPPVQEFPPPAALDPVPLPFSRPAAPTGTDPMAPFRAPEASVDLEDEEEDYFPFGAAAFRPAPPPVAQEAPQPTAPEPLPFAAPSQVEEAEELEDEPLAFFAPSQTAIEEEAPEEVLEEEVLEDEPAEQPVATAAPEPREPLDGLSMVDLAERLAKSLGKHGSSIAPPAGLAAALGARIATPVETAQPAEPEPEFVEELDEEAEEEDVEPARSFEKPTVQLAPPPPVIPEALRPIPLDLEEFGEDEDDLDLSLSFTRPVQPAKAAPPPGAQVFIADALDRDDELDDADEDENEHLSEFSGFGSLLAMKSPFRGPAEYVRIEQPEPEEDVPAQPAVIFPGQEANGQMAAPAPAPAPAPFAAPETPAEPQIRRFDAPGNVAPIEAAPTNRPKVDRDEAERSLRSALATLQRMSGAA